MFSWSSLPVRIAVFIGSAAVVDCVVRGQLEVSCLKSLLQTRLLRNLCYLHVIIER